MNQGHHRVFVFGVVFMGLAMVAMPALAFNPQPEPPGSVAIGLLSSQIARITVVNATDRVSGIVPCVCPVVLTLLDENGTVLGSEQIDVDPGAIGSATFDLRLRRGENLLVRGLVEFPGPEGERLVCNGATRSGLEIVNSEDGATKVTVPIVTSFLPAAE